MCHINWWELPTSQGINESFIGPIYIYPTLPSQTLTYKKIVSNSTLSFLEMWETHIAALPISMLISQGVSEFGTNVTVCDGKLHFLCFTIYYSQVFIYSWLFVNNEIKSSTLNECQSQVMVWEENIQVVLIFLFWGG